MDLIFKSLSRVRATNTKFLREPLTHCLVLWAFVHLLLKLEIAADLVPNKPCYASSSPCLNYVS